MADLADGGGLAHPVYPDEQHHGGLGGQVQRRVPGAEGVGDHPDHHPTGPLHRLDPLRLYPAAQLLHQLQGHVHAGVRQNQRLLQLVVKVVGELRAEAGENVDLFQLVKKAHGCYSLLFNFFPAPGTVLPPLEAVGQLLAAVNAEAGGLRAGIGDALDGRDGGRILMDDLLQYPENHLHPYKEHNNQGYPPNYHAPAARFFLVHGFPPNFSVPAGPGRGLHFYFVCFALQNAILSHGFAVPAPFKRGLFRCGGGQRMFSSFSTSFRLMVSIRLTPCSCMVTP